MEQIARTSKQIGAAIRRVRRSKELTQIELGEKTGLRQATVSKLESGEPGTRLKTLIDILAALELELVVQPRTKTRAEEIEEWY